MDKTTPPTTSIESGAEILSVQAGQEIYDAHKDMEKAASDVEAVLDRPRLEIPDLTPVQFQELEKASLGKLAKVQAADTNRHHMTVVRHRSDILDKLGAKSMSHAVNIVIVEGILPIKLIGQEEPVPHIKPRTFKILSLIAQGITNQKISKRLKVHKNTVTNHVETAKDKLEANNRPHLVRRAYETRVFDFPDVRVKQARYLLARAGLMIEEAGELVTDLRSPQNNATSSR